MLVIRSTYGVRARSPRALRPGGAPQELHAGGARAPRPATVGQPCGEAARGRARRPARRTEAARDRAHDRGRERARDRETLVSFIGGREVEGERPRSFPTLGRLRRLVPDAQIRISTNDAEAHLRMVEAGLGVSVLPRFVVEDGLRSGALADVLP